ncbi:MAG: uroporphyrinogen-III synthase, partial [Caldisphaera sp.]|nr:uroporphyrinogen-III synthase [Caldisphaera sp.]
NCDCIAFTSPRGPKILIEDSKKFNLFNLIIEEISNKKISAVGKETAESVSKYLGKKIDIIPKTFTGYNLAIELSRSNCKCVLLARSQQGIKEINSVLKNNKVKYIEVSLYEEIINNENLTKIRNILKDKKVDYMILSSPLIAENVCKEIKEINNVKIFSIGITTYRKAKEICPDKNIIVPDQYSLESVARFIQNYG